MGWMERIAQWQPSDEVAPFLAQMILLLIVIGMAGCALALFSL